MSKITSNNEIFLDYTQRLNRVPCYNECDGCFDRTLSYVKVS